MDGYEGARGGGLGRGVGAGPRRETLLTPSKITAWLDCGHYLTLKRRVERGELVHEGGSFGSMAQLLADKGLQHEAECLEEYRRQGRSILGIPARRERETFQAWVERVGDPFAQGPDVVCQMPLVHDGIRGIADFLVRVEDPETGRIAYEPVDAKLTRTEAKPGHVLQLCFYADALESLTGQRPEGMHIWLGSGEVETLVVDHFRPYWNRLRMQIKGVLETEPVDAPTEAEPCPHCDFCEFLELCEEGWRAQDSLIYVAGIRQPDRVALEAAGVATLGALAGQDAPIEDLRPERLGRIAGQAQLQVQARERPEPHPPFEVIPVSDDPVWGHGFSQLPPPDAGDVFLDFEGHPFWRPATGLFFLFGLIAQDADGEWRYDARWAHDQHGEAAAVESLIGYLVDRRAAHPDMHVYHYNHTERSALERLAADHGVGEIALAELIDTGMFIDLLLVARNAVQVGTESYGLKHLERLTEYERSHEIDKGAGAVVEYERFTHSADPEALRRIAAYNEDDVRATLALREWLIEHRPADLGWRAARLEPDEGIPELDAHVEALHAFEPGSPQHLFGDVLGYWRREWLAHLAPRLARCGADTATLLDDPEALAGLVPVGLVERHRPNGAPITPAMRFRLPEQATDGFRAAGEQVIYSTPEGPTGYSYVVRLDLEALEVDLAWSERSQELGTLPGVVVLKDWVDPKPKPAALSELADRVLTPVPHPPSPVAMALLRRDPPAFVPGGGPPGGRFSDDVDEMRAWAGDLDHSYVAIQGPPGTGKTYRGAHLVHALVLQRRRVGITAMSHRAIDNMMEEVVKVFEDAGDLDRLVAVKKTTGTQADPLDAVKYTGGNKAAANRKYNVVAGTTWLFAGDDLAAAPVDVLIVDEAGQLALADALAASRSATNLILLGDPLQLPQVAQASHPGGGGASVLEHVLFQDVTMPPERGVFLTETRRMHPDVCSFISEEIYEGRLGSHPSCAVQATEAGTGLRWLPASHAGRSTSSEEEAEIVAAQIGQLLGTTWTTHEGERRQLGVGDVMVVAPFNDQVGLIRARLDRDPLTRGIKVGTVDKFQGGQAAVVFFTMTTSSAADMTRGSEFLFSRNRLNVAVSRARCLAYLVCTEELLNSRARTVPEMRLLSTLCSFVERATAEA